jgi:hypothetical protein
MKKLLLAISALSAALFSTAANADISLSGSANAVYVDAGGNSQAHIGGIVSFGLSTVTDSGITISSSAAISNDNDAAGQNANTSASGGLTSLSFGFANGSITVADDLGVSTGTGLVGELVKHADSNQVAHTNDVELNGDDDGSAVSASTTIGDMSLKAVYVYDDAHGSDIDGGTGTGQSVQLTIPMGTMTLSIASASFDDAGSDSSTFGGNLKMAAGNGTLSLGLESSSNDVVTNEGEAYSLAYATSLGSASVSIGYTGYDSNSTTSNRTDLVVSQSLGGGASMFAELSSLTGAGAAAETSTTAETVIAVGTSVSF